MLVVAHEQLQTRVAAIENDLALESARIVQFASQLSAVEQTLHDAVTAARDQPTNQNIDGITTQRMCSSRVHSALFAFVTDLVLHSVRPFHPYREFRCRKRVI